MRVHVQKLLFVGTQKATDAFLQEMQKLGKVQFAAKPKPAADLIGHRAYDVIRALKILSHYTTNSAKKTAAVPKGDKNGLLSHHRPLSFIIRNPFAYSREIISYYDEIERISTELKAASSCIQIAQKYGTIPWENIAFIEENSQLHFQFFEGSAHRNFALQHPELLLITESGEKHYFVSIACRSSSSPSAVSGLREIDKNELKHLFEKRQHLKDRLHEIESYLKERSRHTESLKNALKYEINKARLLEAKEMRRQEVHDTVFFLAGWAPENHIQEIEKSASQLNIVAEVVCPDADEIIPTYLENTGWARVGEDLVHIYDTPSNHDVDPSWWVLAFFVLFFAIIVGDAGYGLVFLAVALYFKRKNAATTLLGKRVIRLVALLGTACCIWGLLCHSFFGISFTEDAPIRAYSLLTKAVEARGRYHFDQGIQDKEIIMWTSAHSGRTPKNVHDFLYTSPTISTASITADKYSDNFMFEFALFLGTIHIIVGMSRYLFKNYAFFGWITFAIGAYLYFPWYLEATSLIYYVFHVSPQVGAQIGKELMQVGAGFGIIYSIYKHGIAGVFEIMMVVQLFADALSYLRLYALGLAGALVGKIINEAASSMPYTVGVALFILSHAVNLLLSTVGGIIHGLRLNFLEWYHYSFEGGGKRFIPLSLENSD